MYSGFILVWFVEHIAIKWNENEMNWVSIRRPQSLIHCQRTIYLLCECFLLDLMNIILIFFVPLAMRYQMLICTDWKWNWTILWLWSYWQVRQSLWYSTVSVDYALTEAASCPKTQPLCTPWKRHWVKVLSPGQHTPAQCRHSTLDSCSPQRTAFSLLTPQTNDILLLMS